MNYFAASLNEYKRLPTQEVKVGNITIGNFSPIRVQTMTTTDTMDTEATIEQSIRAIEAGAELIRVTAPSKKEAENLKWIKEGLVQRGYDTPLVADIHFTPNAAEIAAKYVEKVRINPGNYADKKRFQTIEYTDESYQEELDKIRKKFVPLLTVCKEYGTAMRIGTNHGSLSDRILSRFGDTALGMVESAMEFLRIARDEDFHNIVLSMKSSNPLVMVAAYRLLAKTMFEEFGMCYPLHLGVTEAGDGEDGRVKSAVGIGTLLEDGLGDTVRVSLTEEPELEIPVCQNLVSRYTKAMEPVHMTVPDSRDLALSQPTHAVLNIGNSHVPVVVADFSKKKTIDPLSCESVGYQYDADLDKWHIGDLAADYIYISNREIDFELPGTLSVIQDYATWMQSKKQRHYPIIDISDFREGIDSSLIFVMVDCSMAKLNVEQLQAVSGHEEVVFVLSATTENAVQDIRSACFQLQQLQVTTPKILAVDSQCSSADEHLIHYAVEAGALLVDGFGDGVFFGMDMDAYTVLADNLYKEGLSGRLYNESKSVEQLINIAAFSILQATRKRITKTEYISCPSCGRTLFDLQETTAVIRQRTHHLKGVKIGIMGCIVNGPGEMADADFGYVGSGVGKITLYKGQEVVKRNVDHSVALEELIELMKENGAWVEP